MVSRSVLAFNFPETREAPLGFPKGDQGHCEEVAQSMKRKSSHCRCRDWQRREQPIT